MTLQELSKATGHNVIAAGQYDGKCYHLLIEDGGNFWKSYYVEGQKLGITLKGTASSNGKLSYKKMPKFISNVQG